MEEKKNEIGKISCVRNKNGVTINISSALIHEYLKGTELTDENVRLLTGRVCYGNNYFRVEMDEIIQKLHESSEISITKPGLIQRGVLSEIIYKIGVKLKDIYKDFLKKVEMEVVIKNGEAERGENGR